MESLLKNDASEKSGGNEVCKKEKTKNFPQYLAATAASVMLMIAGTALGWTSPVLPKLMAENSTLPVTPDESTWIGSLVAIGAIIGPFPAGSDLTPSTVPPMMSFKMFYPRNKCPIRFLFLFFVIFCIPLQNYISRASNLLTSAFLPGICADLIGRKRALLATALPFIASWCSLAVANSVVLLYVGRILAGLANGWGMTLLPMYVGEIATPSERGALGVIGQIMITLGFLYVYVLGPFFSYVWLNIFCSFIPMIFFLFFSFMPETPYYELSKNNHKEAERCLAKLRGKTTEGVKEELMALQAVVDESVRNSGFWSDLFGKRASRKAIFLMFGLMLIQQFSGINVVLFYSETIFKKAGSSLSPAIATIVVGLVMFLASFPTPYLIEQLGRRMVLILSAVGMMIFQGVIGGFFYLEKVSYDTNKLAWLPLVSIIGYICLYSVGIGPVPWAMIGEMFASNVRSKGAALSAAFSWLLAFVMTKSFGFIVDSLGSHTGFWIFAFFCGLGAVFVWAFLPETKGKTLEEIQEILNNQSSKNRGSPEP